MANQKIGIVGYRSRSGLGELNRQLATHLSLSQWLMIRHRGRKSESPFPNLLSRFHDNTASSVKKFVDAVDIILFCEVPFDPRILKLARIQGKKTVCIPMLEWTPGYKREWIPLVDLFICPTIQCYNALKQEGMPCVCFTWPVDLAKFHYRHRDKCDKFLFINGWGGWKGRKGASVVCSAKTLWPEMPLVICSQSSNTSWPDNAELLFPPSNNALLYENGDVLLVPHTVDGLGLEPMEAMACGMPVIIPDAPPWNENPSISKITSRVTRTRVKRIIDWHQCSPESLVASCKSLLGSNISEASKEARQWAEKRSWNNLASKLRKLVTE